MMLKLCTVICSAVLICCCNFVGTSAFVVSSKGANTWRRGAALVLKSTPYEENSDSNSSDTKQQTFTIPQVPLTWDEMCIEASRAIQDAQQECNLNRQIVRVLLPRSSSNANLGLYFEEDGVNSESDSDVVLVPTDESWQGGIMQLYRAAAPTCELIFRKLIKDVGGLPPRVTEDRSVDESGVDGVGLWTASSTSANAEKVKCFVQPTQETVDYIEDNCNKDDGLVLILNPQWRAVDDALDTASKSGGFFGDLANFLGGKGASLKRLDQLGFQSVYTVEGYVCKGREIRLTKRFDSDWYVWCNEENSDGYFKVGSSQTRPTYQECDKMLDESGVVLSYI